MGTFFVAGPVIGIEFNYRGSTIDVAISHKALHSLKNSSALVQANGSACGTRFAKQLPCLFHMRHLIRRIPFSPHTSGLPGAGLVKDPLGGAL